MQKILVSGLINIETTLKVSEFPVHYSPVNYPFFGINSTVSGVGVNIAKALMTLGNQVEFVSLLGNDSSADTALLDLSNYGINTDYIRKDIKSTPQSVIIYDQQGKRQIHVDLKDIQECEYNEEAFLSALDDCGVVALCNINFSRKYLEIAKQKGKTIATDVHVLSDIYDQYNRDFMANADILFLSNENIQGAEEDFVKTIIGEYDNDIIVVGLGARGALLYVKENNMMQVLPAVNTRDIVNTIGAGDALFSCFIYYYNKGDSPFKALQKAILFASYKIGVAGAAQGFLTETELEELYRRHYPIS